MHFVKMHGTGNDYVVIDCEAGMEHISRQTTRDIDILLIVSDPTIRGIIAASRMKELIKELRAHVGQIRLIVNRVEDGLPPQIEEETPQQEGRAQKSKKRTTRKPQKSKKTAAEERIEKIRSDVEKVLDRLEQMEAEA